MGAVQMIISMDKGKLLLLPQLAAGVRVGGRVSQANR
jgi:hypothetical protein